jgi:protocatechuate 3,4-dioxygenase beta subunit
MKPFPCTALFVLALFALAQAQPLSAPAPAPSAATSSCVLTPELTEGPYWLDDELLRTNITEGQAGIPFNLSITVKDITSCLPITNAFVDIWHCNATGAYSGFGGNSGAGQGGPGGMGGSGPSTNETFLRGIAVTDSNGVATFETIQPGWYQGRTPHIHIKVGPNLGVSWCLCSVPHPKSDGVSSIPPFLLWSPDQSFVWASCFWVPPHHHRLKEDSRFCCF